MFSVRQLSYEGIYTTQELQPRATKASLVYPKNPSASRTREHT